MLHLNASYVYAKTSDGVKKTLIFVCLFFHVGFSGYTQFLQRGKKQNKTVTRKMLEIPAWLG